MITLTDDEAAPIKSLLITLRGIKTKDLDKALVILGKRSGEAHANTHFDSQEDNHVCTE